MYLSFFGLRMFPFANTADPRFFYASDAHEEALANMTYAVEQGKGMILITGEVGSGKTLAANVLTQRLRANVTLLKLDDPLIRGDQLLRHLHLALVGPQSRRPDRVTVQTELRDRLIVLHRLGHRVAVLVDEAQDLSRGALEQLRLMSNWEHAAEKLVQWILVGQPELRDRLARSEWEHLRQRIVLTYHLTRLRSEQVRPYVEHRMNVAAGGGQANAAWAPGVPERIFAASGGAPRLINNLCDAALLTAFAEERHLVNDAILDSVLREMSTCGWRETKENEQRFSVLPTEGNYKLPVALAG